MKDLKPAVFVWRKDDCSFAPLSEYLPLCLRQFVPGETYRLSAAPERTRKEHDHFFAVVEKAYNNLPERFDGVYRNADHLRYRCLIECGFCHEKVMVRPDAELYARYLLEIQEDVHTQISPDSQVVTVWTAKSMAYASMNRDEFRKATDAVFKLLSDMLGVNVTELKKNAEEAA